MYLWRKAGRLLLGSRVEDDPGDGHDGDLDLGNFVGRNLQR
jgi:hypothetical protein